MPPCLRRAALTLVAVAPRADDRFELSVLTVSVGLPRGVLVLVRAGCMAEDAIASGKSLEGGGTMLNRGVDT
jgi:hypothetical protein